MYRAKRDGRDQIAVGSSPTDSHSQRRWVERELKRALAEDGLDIAFQPVIDLRDGQPVGAEALLRWQVDGYAIPAARAIEDRNPGEKTMRSRSGSPAMRG